MPVGLLYAFAQKQAQLTRWTMAGALAFLVVGLPLLHSTLTCPGPAGDRERLLGHGIGAWLGTQVWRHLAQLETWHRDAPATLSEPNRSAGEAGAGQAARRIVQC